MKATKVFLVSAFSFALLTNGYLISGLGKRASAGGLAPIAEPTQCSEATIQGTYVFALNGSVKDIGPVALSGTATYDGFGQASLKGFINSTTGDPATAAELLGIYTVDPATCTASATFDVPFPGVYGISGESQFEAVIVNGGAETRYVVTTPGIAVAGASVRQFP
jgi:hypothetical protein